MDAPTPQEAAAEGASAIRYRIERLKGIVHHDDALIAELLERWKIAAMILDGMAGRQSRMGEL